MSLSRDVYQDETVRAAAQAVRAGRTDCADAAPQPRSASAEAAAIGVRACSAGSYLDADLGTDYAALGVTARAGSATHSRLDKQARMGFDVLARPLGPPAEHSVE